jgi:hypothetical protein
MASEIFMDFLQLLAGKTHGDWKGVTWEFTGQFNCTRVSASLNEEFRICRVDLWKIA